MFSNIDFVRSAASVFGYAWITLGVLTACALAGKFIFEQRLSQLKDSDKIIQKSNSLVIHEGSAILDRDAPIILDVIEPYVNFQLSARLEEGMQIPAHPIDWKVSGRSIVQEFYDAWNSGSVDFTKDENIYQFKFEGPMMLELAASHKKGKAVELVSLGAKYFLSHRFYLGHTGLLPSSSELKDQISGGKKRVFGLADLERINTSAFKSYVNLSDVPDQGAEVIKFLLRPVLTKMNRGGPVGISRTGD